MGSDEQHEPFPMLGEVSIDGLGLIDRAELVFRPGLNVLTGETGAGKTLVVTALQLLSGKRAAKGSVKAGASQAVVQGVISPLPTTAVAWCDEGDDELLITREIAGGDGGRNRVRIQGRLAPVSQLDALLGHTIELHGQHESLAMADPEVQRALLDRFDRAHISPLLDKWHDVWSRWRQARRIAHDARTNAAANAREAAQLHRELEAIEAVNPQPGEEDDLKAAVRRMQHGEALAQAYHTAMAALSGEGGIQDQLGQVQSAFTHVAAIDPSVGNWVARLDTLSAEVTDLAAEVATNADEVDMDPAAFEAAMNRMADLKQLFRLYGASSADVLAHADYARDRLALIDGGEERLVALDAEVEALTVEMQVAGDTLHTARTKAAKKLAKAVQQELADLAMGAATISIVVERGKPGAHGMDTVRFLITTNPGQPPVTLDHAASGGERSRIALAVKVALADADDVSIMVFDEVDAGIGGQTARAVGEKLQRLATRKQVLCVTHLAQIAAYADTHFLITKNQGRTTTSTTVQALDSVGRQAEIARMLSGTPDEQVALDHADQLVAESQRTASLH